MKGLTALDSVLAGVGVELDFGRLVQAHAVFELEPLDLLGR
jgi:hypothetical protein